MNTLSVSVLVPTYNRDKYLPECLDSILSQTLPPAQVIVINDGSTDATEEVLAPYFGRIEYLKKANGGKSSALNAGMERVTGECVWIFDDDDVALPDALERHVRALETETEAGFTYSSALEAQELPDGNLVVKRETNLPLIKKEELFVQLMEKCFIHHPAIVVRKKCYDIVGAFNTRLLRSQDYEMLLRLSHSFEGIRINGPTFITRRHTNPRGPATHRIQYQDRYRRWYHYDGDIFEELYRTIPLYRYLTPTRPRNTLDEAKTRKALLQRMCIMMRKGLWRHAVGDLTRVTNELAHIGFLTKEEEAICSRALVPFDNTIAIDEFLTRTKIPRQISRICNNQLGKTIRLVFFKTSYYYFRQEIRANNIVLALRCLPSMFILLGARNFVLLFHNKIRALYTVNK